MGIGAGRSGPSTAFVEGRRRAGGTVSPMGRAPSRARRRSRGAGGEQRLRAHRAAAESGNRKLRRPGGTGLVL